MMMIISITFTLGESDSREEETSVDTSVRDSALSSGCERFNLQPGLSRVSSRVKT